MSFVYNYLYKGEREKTTLDKLMIRPYGRVAVMHITILLGGALSGVLGSPVWIVFVLIALKTAMDVMLHSLEHQKKYIEETAAEYKDDGDDMYVDPQKIREHDREFGHKA